jgi:hypothetical protein
MKKIKYKIPCFHCPRNGRQYYNTVQVRPGPLDSPHLIQIAQVYVKQGKCPKCGGTGILEVEMNVFDFEVVPDKLIEVPN